MTVAPSLLAIQTSKLVTSKTVKLIPLWHKKRLFAHRILCFTGPTDYQLLEDLSELQRHGFSLCPAADEKSAAWRFLACNTETPIPASDEFHPCSLKNLQNPRKDYICRCTGVSSPSWSPPETGQVRERKSPGLVIKCLTRGGKCCNRGCCTSQALAVSRSWSWTYNKRRMCRKVPGLESESPLETKSKGLAGRKRKGKRLLLPQPHQHHSHYPHVFYIILLILSSVSPSPCLIITRTQQAGSRRKEDELFTSPICLAKKSHMADVGWVGSCLECLQPQGKIFSKAF